VSGVTKLSKWTADDFSCLALFGAICIVGLGAAIFVIGFSISRLSCEFYPTTERCTVLHERGSSR